MTALEAIRQARETGQIAITGQTANMLEAVENFLDAAEALTTAIDENVPEEMVDNETLDGIFTDFYWLLSPVQDYVFKTVGNIILNSALLYGLKDKFEGL